MNLIRPLAGTVLFALLLAPSATLAESVIDITPGGGHADISPPSRSDDGRDEGASGTAGTRPADTGPADTGPADTTPRSGGGHSSDHEGNGDSDRSGTPEVDVQPGLQTRHFGAMASISCKVSAHATDLVVVNQGSEPLPPGTRIKWQLRDRGERGYFAIIGELPAGKSLVADNVLKGGAAQGDACIARVI